MRVLLDTHSFLWFIWNDANLSSAARQVIAKPANDVQVSVASCWEIAIKCGRGKLTLGEAAASFFPRELASNRFTLLAIELGHAAFVETLPPHHKDPFDRMLIAQALVEQISIVSNETTFDAYGVMRIW